MSGVGRVSRWVVVAAVLCGPAHAAEVEVEPVHARFFAGGYGAGAFIGPSTFSASPLGLAVDLGAQFNRSLSLSLQLRAATFFIAHQFLVSSSVEWSIGRFSVATGVGAAVLMVSALPGWMIRPALAVPLGLGLTLGDVTSSRTLAVRLNLEFALLLEPGPWNVGGTTGISVGVLSR